MTTLRVAAGLALRSAGAHRGRALATLAAVALATVVLCLFLTAESRFGKVLATPVRELSGGDIMIVPAGVEYTQLASGYPGLVRRSEWGESVLSKSEIAASLEGLSSLGHPSPSILLLESFAGGRQVPLIARDWAVSDAAHSFSDRIVAGRYFTPGDEGRPVVLWDGALRHRPEVGAVVDLLLPSLAVSGGNLRFDYSRPASVEVEVIGHYRLRGGLRTGSVLMPLSTLRDLTGLAEDHVLWMAYTVDDHSLVPALTAAVRERLPGHRVYGPGDIYRIIFSGVGQRAAELEDPRVTLTFLGLMYVVAGLIVANNTMLTTALRHRELALMRAVGARPVHVYLAVLLEAVILGAVGAAVGFGLITALLSVSALIAGEGFWDLAVLSGLNLSRSIILASLAAALGAAIPARRAASVAPLEALRHE